MKQTICDVCKKNASNEFKYLFHLDNFVSINHYTDSEGNLISGRYITVDLCNKCYNEIVGCAVDKLKKKQNEQRNK